MCRPSVTATTGRETLSAGARQKERSMCRSRLGLNIAAALCVDDVGCFRPDCIVCISLCLSDVFPLGFRDGIFSGNMTPELK